jgi:simple sugar transport system permease protein
VTVMTHDHAAAPRADGCRNRLHRPLLTMPAGAILLVFVAVQLVCIAAGLLFPDDFRYLSPQNMGILMRSVPVLGCLALGAGVLMIAGEFDLSIGSVYTFTAVRHGHAGRQRRRVPFSPHRCGICSSVPLIGLLNGQR